MSPETRMMGLPDGEEIMIVGQTMWTQSTSVTDRQTDRRTDGRADRQTELLSQRPCNAECRTVKTEILTPCRSETPENIKTKIALNYCVCHRPLYLANFRFRSSFRSRSRFRSSFTFSFSFSFRFSYRSSSSYTTSGDIF